MLSSHHVATKVLKRGEGERDFSRAFYAQAEKWHVELPATCAGQCPCDLSVTVLEWAALFCCGSGRGSGLLSTEYCVGSTKLDRKSINTENENTIRK